MEKQRGQISHIQEFQIMYTDTLPSRKRELHQHSKYTPCTDLLSQKVWCGGGGANVTAGKLNVNYLSQVIKGDVISGKSYGYPLPYSFNRKTIEVKC